MTLQLLTAVMVGRGGLTILNIFSDHWCMIWFSRRIRDVDKMSKFSLLLPYLYIFLSWMLYSVWGQLTSRISMLLPVCTILSAILPQPSNGTMGDGSSKMAH